MPKDTLVCCCGKIEKSITSGSTGCVGRTQSMKTNKSGESQHFKGSREGVGIDSDQ